jgi:hypothetical protein
MQMKNVDVEIPKHFAVTHDITLSAYIYKQFHFISRIHKPYYYYYFIICITTIWLEE